ncbi:MAG TPA: glycosyltransferase [Candidatus Saccharimonadales bacterium]|nr:glycosyltransferase [Candidatus Saccharimonadales bacterium]
MSVLFYMFIIVGIINLLHIAFFVIGGNVYDTIWAAKKRSLDRSRRPRYRNPLISVLVPAYNEALVIERCLDSIRKSSYKKVQVIVIDDSSQDLTGSLVRKYIKDHPTFPLQLISRRHNQGKALGLNYAAKKYAKGDLIMTLDADSVLHKNALKNTVRYFDDPQIVGVAANVRIMEEFSFLGLLQRFEHMVAYRSKKFFTVMNCELVVGGVASTYRREILDKVHYYDSDTVTEDIGLSMKIAGLGNKRHRLVYASDVVAMTEGVLSFKALFIQRFRWKLGNLQNLIKYRRMLFSTNRNYSFSLSWYRIPMAYLGEIIILLEPIIMAYIIYLSVRFLTPAMLLGAYSVITLYLLLIILPDEHMNFHQKLKSAFFAPFVYFMFYVMNIVQLVSIVRCIWNADKVFDLVKSSGTWTSPRRSGRTASSF